MKVLIDIGHPGHVHLFRNFAHIFIGRGHQVLFTIRDKEHEADLLKYESLTFISLGKHYSSKAGKIWGLIKYNIRILLISQSFKPDIYLSHGSVYTLLSALLLGRPNIALEDTGNPEQVRLYLPFTDAVLTSARFPHLYGEKQVFYNSYHELAYLHPDYFAPDKNVLKELGLKEGEKFSIVRLVAWTASHDRKAKGITPEQRELIVRHLMSKGQLFISSEKPLPSDFSKFRFPLGPERMHHALAFASLFVGEGATMASESIFLGTAAIYINSMIPGIITEQEKESGLLNAFTGFEGVLGKIDTLLENPLQKTETKTISERLIRSKCNLTAFLVEFVEGWPDSYIESKTSNNQ
jgi:predicted glycosyltransferase